MLEIMKIEPHEQDGRYIFHVFLEEKAQGKGKWEVQLSRGAQLLDYTQFREAVLDKTGHLYGETNIAQDWSGTIHEHLDKFWAANKGKTLIEQLKAENEAAEARRVAATMHTIKLPNPIPQRDEDETHISQDQAVS
jgi:hypothetical protein